MLTSCPHKLPFFCFDCYGSGAQNIHAKLAAGMVMCPHCKGKAFHFYVCGIIIPRVKHAWYVICDSCYGKLNKQNRLPYPSIFKRLYP